MRRILGVVGGIVAGSLIVFCVEWLGHTLFPPPPGFEATIHGGHSSIGDLPLGALAFVILGWSLGALGAGWAAAKISGDIRTAITVGFFMTLAGVMTMLHIPHPIWMWVLGIALPLPLAWLGAKGAGVPSAPAGAGA